MTTTLPRALVYMTGRDCERYVRAAIESLAFQTHEGIHVLFVDDASRDQTHEVARRLLAEHFDGRHTLVRNPQNWGKARNAHVHLRAALGEGDFVAVLDADDQLIVATALAQMAAEYAAGHDVVWTNYETDGGAVGGNGPLDPFRSPRGQGWKTSHFFSFRSALFASVPEDRFQDERGEWLTAACDFAIAFPLLDQTRRYKYLPIRAYRYTATNPASHHNRDAQSQGLNSRRQQDSAQRVLAKPPLPCTRWLLGDTAPADEALGLVRQGLHLEMQAAAKRLDAGLTQLQMSSTLAAPVPAADPWTQAAAMTLAQRCPAWVALAMDGRGEAMDVRSAWHWWQWLQAGPAGRAPRVLEIGGGPLAAPLQAAVQALGGRMLSVCGDRQRALDLYARLQAAGVDGEVLHVPLTEVGFDALEGQLPDLSLLPEDAAGFDLLLVSAAEAGAAPADALLALPLAVGRLDPQAFRICFWAPGDAPLRQRAGALWGQLAPDLDVTDGAFHGDALCVQPR